MPRIRQAGEDQPTVELRELEGVDWSDDKLFYTYSWADETSEFDDHPSVRWNGTSYSRDYKMRVPIALRGNEELVEAFVTMIIDNFEGVDGPWVE